MTETMHSVRLGTAPSHVVALHGWGRSLGDFRPLAQLLEWEHTVHLLDLPGFGKTPPPPADWGTSDYAEAVTAYLDQQGLEQVHLLGHSFGGRICLRLAAARQDRVKSLTLIGSHGLPAPQPLPRQLRSRAISALRTGIKWFDGQFGTEHFKNWFTPRYGSRDYLAAGKLRGTLVKTVTEDQTANCRAINAPTLLLWGALDRETPLALGERFHELISGSRLIVLEGQDHYPFRDVGAHLIAYYMLPFLREAAGSGAKEAA